MIDEFTRRPKWFQICRQWCFTKFIVSLNSTTHQTERFLKGSLGTTQVSKQLPTFCIVYSFRKI